MKINTLQPFSKITDSYEEYKYKLLVDNMTDYIIAHSDDPQKDIRQMKFYTDKKNDIIDRMISYVKNHEPTKEDATLSLFNIGFDMDTVANYELKNTEVEICY